MTDLYETPDLPGEAEATEDKPGETIEQITAKVLSRQAARIKELERELEAAKFDLCLFSDKCDSCKHARIKGGRWFCSRPPRTICDWQWRGPVAGENVEVEDVR